jgi:hypothetical protein
MPISSSYCAYHFFFYGECHGLIYDDNHKVNLIKEGSSNDDIINQVYFDDYKGLP